MYDSYSTVTTVDPGYCEKLVALTHDAEGTITKGDWWLVQWIGRGRGTYHSEPKSCIRLQRLVPKRFTHIASWRVT